METEFRVRFLPSGREASVAAGTTLLEAARGAGLPVASACGADGICARCGMEILEGDPGPETDAERSLKDRNRIDAELRLSCRIAVESDLVATARYW